MSRGRPWAKGLGLDDAGKLLGQTLAEEKAADGLLNQLATSEVNKEAYASRAGQGNG